MLAAWGLVCASAVYVAGLFVGTAGSAATTPRCGAHRAREVQRSFAALTSELERQARDVADAGRRCAAALNEDLPATRALFERLAQAPDVDERRCAP